MHIYTLLCIYSQRVLKDCYLLIQTPNSLKSLVSPSIFQSFIKGAVMKDCPVMIPNAKTLKTFDYTDVLGFFSKNVQGYSFQPSQTQKQPLFALCLACR